MVTRMITRPVVIGALSLGAVVALGTIAGVAAIGSAPTDEERQSRVEAIVPALASDASGDDDLPDGMDPDSVGERGLDEATVRYLGASEQADFWVGLDRGSNVCLVVVVSDSLSGACTNLDYFETVGVGMSVTTPLHYTEAYLVPAGLSAHDLPPGLVHVTDELVVGDSRSVGPGAIEFRSDEEDGTSVRVELQHPGP